MRCRVRIRKNFVYFRLKQRYFGGYKITIVDCIASGLTCPRNVAIFIMSVKFCEIFYAKKINLIMRIPLFKMGTIFL